MNIRRTYLLPVLIGCPHTPGGVLLAAMYFDFVHGDCAICSYRRITSGDRFWMMVGLLSFAVFSIAFSILSLLPTLLPSCLPAYCACRTYTSNVVLPLPADATSFVPPNPAHIARCLCIYIFVTRFGTTVGGSFCAGGRRRNFAPLPQPPLPPLYAAAIWIAHTASLAGTIPYLLQNGVLWFQRVNIIPIPLFFCARALRRLPFYLIPWSVVLGSLVQLRIMRFLHLLFFTTCFTRGLPGSYAAFISLRIPITRVQRAFNLRYLLPSFLAVFFLRLRTALLI